jgi:hypothetical protein
VFLGLKPNDPKMKPWAQREQEEEDLMIQEVAAYGNVLSTVGFIARGMTPADMVINKGAFWLLSCLLT